MSRKFSVIIEQDEDGVFVGRVPELKGCLSQGDTIEELLDHIKEAIAVCLEAADESTSRFVDVKTVEVEA